MTLIQQALSLVIQIGELSFGKTDNQSILISNRAKEAIKILQELRETNLRELEVGTYRKCDHEIG